MKINQITRRGTLVFLRVFTWIYIIFPINKLFTLSIRLRLYELMYEDNTTFYCLRESVDEEIVSCWTGAG